MTFTHEVHEHATVDRRETWHAELAGYHVTIEQRDGSTVVGVSLHADRSARPLVKVHPTCVADLDHVAAVLPDVLRAAAAALRAAGFDDLRSPIDVMLDQQRQMLDAASRRSRRHTEPEGTP